MASAAALFLAPAFILIETVKNVIIFGIYQTGTKLSALTLAFGAEFAKGIAAFIFLLRWRKKLKHAETLFDVLMLKGSVQSNLDYFKLAVPAATYLINNVLYLLGISISSPATMSVAVMAKLPFTAILHHFLIRPQPSLAPWVSLLVLFIGLAIYSVPKVSINLASPDTVALLMGLFMSAMSAFTAIYTEKILKSKIEFWPAQVWLYAYGSFFSASLLLLSAFVPEGALPISLPSLPAFETTGAHLIIICISAASGLVVANILRRADNLVKLVGAAASVSTVYVAQLLFFPELREKSLNLHSIIGIAILTLGTIAYNYYKGRPEERPGFIALQPTSTDNKSSTLVFSADDNVDMEDKSPLLEDDPDESAHREAIR